jgi:hypothetical protein
MSVEGEFARLTPQLLEEVRAAPAGAYDRVTRMPAGDWLDLERSFGGLAILLEAEGVPVNPITAGAAFPDEQHAWGTTLRSRSLTAAEVAQAAASLREVPFARLERHRYFLAVRENARRPIDEQALDNRMARLGEFYPSLAAFFAGAAERGLCTIFWTA